MDDQTGMCPECKQGKHENCTRYVLDDHDVWVLCACWKEC